MFRKIISSTLLGLLLFSLFYNSVIWIKYELNVEEVTELFCINKDKPELQCFGKCSIKRKLIDFSLLPESTEPPAEALYMPALKNFVVKEQSVMDFSFTLFTDSRQESFFYLFWQSCYPDPIFTPPQLFV